MAKLKNLIGRRSGKLIVVEFAGRDSSNRAKWKCKCDCGNYKIVLARHLSGKRSTKSCGCYIKEVKYKLLMQGKSWGGYGEISGQYFNHLKYLANRRGIEFNIDIEYAWNLYLKQNCLCSLSGQEIIFTRNRRTRPKVQTSSLDRIDSNKGYIEGNVQWVHKIVNNMKQSLPDIEFIKWCKLISNYRNYD